MTSSASIEIFKLSELSASNENPLLKEVLAQEESMILKAEEMDSDQPHNFVILSPAEFDSPRH